MRNAIRWIDAVKGVAILAVVAMHCEYPFPNGDLFDVWSLFGNSWHVGVFFLVAGFFVREEELLRPVAFIKKKFRGIYTKLLVAYAVGILLHNVLLQIGWYSPTYDYGGKTMLAYSATDILKNMLLAALGAGREPILSPLWFVYCLFAAFCLLSITARYVDAFVRRTGFGSKNPMAIRTVVLLTLCLAGHALTNIVGISIPRYANVFTICWLLHIGSHLFRHCRFDNGRMALLGAAMVYVSTVLFGPNLFVTNEYHNVLSMTLCTCGALYMFSYVFRRWEDACLTSVFAQLGRSSFHIMAWHILSFHVAAWGLSFIYPDVCLYETVPSFTEAYLLPYYIIAGVVLPMGVHRLCLYARSFVGKGQ